MNCRDCLHYRVCESNTKGSFVLPKVSMFFDKGAAKCIFFTDKSEYIHLPCKVGDIVYHYCSDFSTILPYFVENLNVAFLGNKDEQLVYTFEANCNTENEDELLDSIDFELKDIGKTVFLTRKEAERALEEGKNK